MCKIRKIGFIGFGVLGQQIHGYFERHSEEKIDYLFFDDYYKESPDNTYPFQSYQENQFKDVEFIVGLGYKHLTLKNQIIDWLKENGRKQANFIHPSAIIESGAKIGNGVAIYPRVIVEPGVQIGDGVVLNVGATVCHDSTIQDATFIAPRVCILGHVQIGYKCFIGSSSTISNNITVGNDCIIGQASSVTHDLPSGTTAIGNPLSIKNIQIK